MAAITLAIVVAAASGCASKPPDVRITAGDVAVPAVLGTHCWTNGCADYPTPPQQLRTAGYQPVRVPGGAKLTVTFTSPPKDGKFIINQWVGDNARSATMTVPTEPGIYTYDVAASWQRGSASYAFQVEVP